MISIEGQLSDLGALLLCHTSAFDSACFLWSATSKHCYRFGRGCCTLHSGSLLSRFSCERWCQVWGTLMRSVCSVPPGSTASGWAHLGFPRSSKYASKPHLESHLHFVPPSRYKTQLLHNYSLSKSGIKRKRGLKILLCQAVIQVGKKCCRNLACKAVEMCLHLHPELCMQLDMHIDIYTHL